MSKTSSFLRILYQVSLAPGRCLPESRVRELLGNPSKSTWHRQINELLEGTADAPALLIETENPGGERQYCLNTKEWESFINAHYEGRFLLECYRQVGHLLDSEFTNMVLDVPEGGKKLFERLGRKFFYLAKVSAHKTEKSRKTLDAIIRGLVGEKCLELTYDGGLRIVRPLCLVQNRDELYLVAYRQKDDGPWERRTYKLSRISGIRLLDKGFKYPPKSEWDPMQEYKNASGLIVGEVKRVRIAIYGHSRKIISEKDFMSGELVARDKDFDTYLFSYTNPDEFLGQLFVYAQDAEILDDEILRAKFLKKAEDAIKRNDRRRIA